MSPGREAAWREKDKPKKEESPPSGANLPKTPHPSRFSDVVTPVTDPKFPSAINAKTGLPGRNQQPKLNPWRSIFCV
jgi:hypothetical protein